MIHIALPGGFFAVATLAYLHYINQETLILLAMVAIIVGCVILARKATR
jgi:hypothetical protein